jgi:hypothetical protein
MDTVGCEWPAAYSPDGKILIALHPGTVTLVFDTDVWVVTVA